MSTLAESHAPESSEIVIRRLESEADSRRWDEFVHGCGDATFFHLTTWKGLFEDVFRHGTHYFYAERGGRIVAVLPLVEVRSLLFGHSLVSLPFCAYGGIAGDDAAAPLLEAAADELARDAGVEYVEFRNLRERHAGWPKQDVYVTFRKEISADDDENLKAIPRKQRAMVRKGIKNGLVGVRDDGVRRFYALYADNVRRHGTPALPERYFAELLRRFGEACDVLTIEDSGGRPVSSVLSFYFRDEVLPYYAGDLPDARDLAANDFKYFELMKRAAARGARLFDYGRSKVGTGPWSFKRNWGFEPQTLSYEYRLLRRAGVPQNNPLNPKYRLFIAAWRRLPLRVANSLGPAIARHLG